jgi:hypothetical protein
MLGTFAELVQVSGGGAVRRPWLRPWPGYEITARGRAFIEFGGVLGRALNLSFDPLWVRTVIGSLGRRDLPIRWAVALPPPRGAGEIAWPGTRPLRRARSRSQLAREGLHSPNPPRRGRLTPNEASGLAEAAQEHTWEPPKLR